MTTMEQMWFLVEGLVDVNAKFPSFPLKKLMMGCPGFDNWFMSYLVESNMKSCPIGHTY